MKVIVAIVLAMLVTDWAHADSVILGPEDGFSSDAIKERISKGYWVFVGRAVDVREVVVCDSTVAPPDSGLAVSVTAMRRRLRPRFVNRFRVERIWQGEMRAREVEVASGGEFNVYRYGGGEGVVFQFIPGRRYLVFATGGAGHLVTRLTSGNYALRASKGPCERQDAEVALVDSLFSYVQHSRRKTTKPNM